MQYWSILSEIRVVLIMEQWLRCYAQGGFLTMLELPERDTNFFCAVFQSCSGWFGGLVFCSTANSWPSRCCKLHVFWTNRIFEGTRLLTPCALVLLIWAELCPDWETRMLRSDEGGVPCQRPLKLKLQLFDRRQFLKEDC